MKRLGLIGLGWIALLATSCRTANITKEIEDETDSVKLEVGPIQVGTFAVMSIRTELSGYDLKPPEETYVFVTFPFAEYDTVTFLAGKDRFSFARVRFQEGLTRVKLSDFLKIGYAGRLAVLFDTDEPKDELHGLSTTDLKLLHRYTTLVDFYYEKLRLERPAE